MNLNLSKIENLKETKHLYGCRLVNLSKNEFYDNLDTKNYVSLIPCSDSEDNKDTETESKISALKKLCGILKNMNQK